MRCWLVRRIRTRGRDDLSPSQLNEDSSRTNDYRVPLADYLEMMLRALIKWHLPFPVKRAAREEYRGGGQPSRLIPTPPPPPPSHTVNEKLPSFATLAVATIAIVHEGPI